MFRRFKTYCEKNKLLQPDDKVILAVSGGIDSMLMANLFLQSGWNFSVAHCNFSLRGSESDGDEVFVKEWCQLHHITFHATRFDTKKYAEDNKLSVQMAARELRYEWFDTLCTQHQYSKIAVAHNANDNTETMLLNFTRGTGIKGLCGIQVMSGNVIRPLLFATRHEIMRYVQAERIDFREDSSNLKTDYARNRVRHNVIPELSKINPSFITTSQHNADYLLQVAKILASEKAHIVSEVCSNQGDELHIDIVSLLRTNIPAFWLFEILQPYDFSGEVVHKLYEALGGPSGKCFYSKTHAALKDRKSIIVYKIGERQLKEDYVITSECAHLDVPFEMCIEKKDNAPHFVIPTDKDIACIDAATLQFPLCLRKWKNGDVFVPLGTRGTKKVSDFLIDIKMPLHQKKRQWVLQSGSNIVWVVGQRIDERHKISSQTKQLVIFKKL